MPDPTEDTPQETQEEKPQEETQAEREARWAADEHRLRTMPIASRRPLHPSKPTVFLHGSPALIRDAVRKALMRGGQEKQADAYVKRVIGGPAKDLLAISLEFVDFELEEEKTR